MFGAMDTAATGVGLGRVWMDVIANNVANANTVRPAGEAPFRASTVQATASRDMTGVRRPANNPDGQPDPMRTSIDSMGAGARRGGGGGNGNRNRGGGGGGGGYGARNNTTRKYGS